MALDLNSLWDFQQPALSEQRFRAELAQAHGDDVLILQTQIARSYGLRQEFDRAREILESIRERVVGAGAEARARYVLELGRTFASATHPPDSQTPAARTMAREAFEQSVQIAREAHLDALTIDALHMLAFVDTAPADQIRWAREALAVSLASGQAAARRWEPSLRNNLGYALHQSGRYDEALAEFQQALSLREKAGDAARTREARWMVAWTLRSQGRLDDALALQLRLERECAEAKAPDPYVFEELDAIYKALGNTERAQHYAALRKKGAE